MMHNHPKHGRLRQERCSTRLAYKPLQGGDVRSCSLEIQQVSISRYQAVWGLALDLSSDPDQHSCFDVYWSVRLHKAILVQAEQQVTKTEAKNVQLMRFEGREDVSKQQLQK